MAIAGGDRDATTTAGAADPTCERSRVSSTGASLACLLMLHRRVAAGRCCRPHGIYRLPALGRSPGRAARLPGPGRLLGVGYWLASATGLGFLVSGPRDRGALGFSIATAAVAGLHLSSSSSLPPDETRTVRCSGVQTRGSEVAWDAFVTQIRALPVLLFAKSGLATSHGTCTRESWCRSSPTSFEIGRMVLLFSDASRDHAVCP